MSYLGHNLDVLFRTYLLKGFLHIFFYFIKKIDIHIINRFVLYMFVVNLLLSVLFSFWFVTSVYKSKLILLWIMASNVITTVSKKRDLPLTSPEDNDPDPSSTKITSKNKKSNIKSAKKIRTDDSISNQLEDLRRDSETL